MVNMQCVLLTGKAGIYTKTPGKTSLMEIQLESKAHYKGKVKGV